MNKLVTLYGVIAMSCLSAVVSDGLLMIKTR